MENKENDSFDANYIEPKQAEKIYPTLGQAWGLFGIFLGATLVTGFVFGLIITILASTLATGESLITTSGWLQLATYISIFVFTLILARYYVKGSRMQAVSLSMRAAPMWIFPVLVLATPALSTLSEAIVVLIPKPNFLAEIFKTMVPLTPASFLTAVVAAPVLEEIFCRGIILEGLLRNGYRNRDAVLWSALIFAVMHMNPWQGVAAMAVGCFAGWIYVETRSLWPCIFIHFLNNGLAFLGLFVTRSNYAKDISELTGEAYPCVLAAAAIVFVACLYIFRMKFAAKVKQIN